MPPHKKQHFVPQSYLKAWVDPSAPPGYDPYVWFFSKDGKTARRSAPRNLFYETDLYTISRGDGFRDLRFERGLAQLEGEFARIRREVLEEHAPLSDDDRLALCAFVAASRGRTPSMRDHVVRQWTPVHEYEQLLRSRAARGVTMPPPTAVGTPVRIDVEAILRHPMQTAVRDAIGVEAPLLMSLDLAIVDARESPGFITSDNPCVWFDSEAHKRHPMFRSPGLGSRTIEVTLPISPHQLLLLNRGGCVGYCTARTEGIDEVNRRTRFGCDEYFVVRENTRKDVWFDPGTAPEDSRGKPSERRDPA